MFREQVRKKKDILVITNTPTIQHTPIYEFVAFPHLTPTEIIVAI